jgi:hypothetical protein
MEMNALAVTLILLSLFASSVASQAQTSAAKAPASSSIKIAQRLPTVQEKIC